MTHKLLLSNLGLPLQPLVDLLLHPRPQLKHLQITKRKDLRRDHARHAVLPVTPPVQVGDPRPGHSLSRAARVATGDHEAEAPALRIVRGGGIQAGAGGAHVRFTGDHLLLAQGRQVGDLVLKHLFDGLGAEDLPLGGWGGAVVEEDGEDSYEVEYLLMRVKGG